MSAIQMQARSSTNGQLYTWTLSSVDFTGTGFPGPGVANDVAVAMRPASSAGGGGSGDVLGLGSSVAHRLAGFANAGGKQLEQTSFLASEVALKTVPEFDNFDSGTAKTIALSNGEAQKLRMTGNCTLSITLDRIGWTQVRYYQDGVGGRTLTHPGTFQWVGGSAPVIATGANVSTLVSYYYNGTTVYGSAGGGGGAGDLKSDGSVAMAADFDLANHKLQNVQDAVGSDEGTNLGQVQALIAAAIAGAGGGGGDGFSFTFSTTTADADPGAGTLRINNATPGVGMTQIFVDLADTASNDITAWLDRLDDSIGSVKGYIRVGSKSDRTKWLLFSLQSVTTATGYRKLGVTYVAGPALPLTTAGDCFLSFESMGLIGLITDALVDPAAAIALSKLANGTACSFVGHGANNVGALALISVGTNGFVALRRSNVLTAGLLLGENLDPAINIATTGTASFGSSTTLFQADKIASTTRSFVGLLLGSDATATDLPASGGIGVILIGYSLDIPVVKPGGNAGFTVWSHDVYGLSSYSQNGVEQTIATSGSGTTATRKLVRLDMQPITQTLAATTQVSAIECDTTSINGQNFDNGVLNVTCTVTMYQQGGNNYSHTIKKEACFHKRSGALSLRGSVGGTGVLGDTNAPTVATLDASGSLIRMRIAPFDATSVVVFATMTVTGISP